jgi:mannose-6-phosphate isomerase-like protein (cupin superfamily)
MFTAIIVDDSELSCKLVSEMIKLGCHFQFKNNGTETLKFVVVTMTPRPGPDEAFYVEGKW